MENLGARAPSWRRCFRIALVAAGVALLPAGPGEAAETGGQQRLPSPGLGCGQDGGAFGTGLLARARHAGKRGAKAKAPTATAPQPLPEEPPSLFLHAFYTCATVAPAPVPMGAGWLAMGPVRRG